MTNRSENLSQYGTIPTGLSDHFIVYCTRRVSKYHFKNQNTTKIRSLKNYSAELLLEKLSSAEWNSLFTSECVDFAWKCLQNIFIKILDEVAPVKEVRLKQRTEPCMTSDIFELLRVRDRFLYTFKSVSTRKPCRQVHKQGCPIFMIFGVLEGLCTSILNPLNFFVRNSIWPPYGAPPGFTPFGPKIPCKIPEN